MRSITTWFLRMALMTATALAVGPTGCNQSPSGPAFDSEPIFNFPGTLSEPDSVESSLRNSFF